MLSVISMVGHGMGRDIGKLKKDGFLRGTHARRISFMGIFGVLGLSAAYTVYKV